uniref:Uncharacterized protein n=1 Tax=viral metagenome TaxID=1070528 RepID=A0A6C0D7S1_9ZZZZ
MDLMVSMVLMVLMDLAEHLELIVHHVTLVQSQQDPLLHSLHQFQRLVHNHLQHQFQHQIWFVD